MFPVNLKSKHKDEGCEFLISDFPFGGVSLFPMGESLVSNDGRVNDLAIDVKEGDKEIIVSADVPGMECDDIKVTLNDNILIIRAHREKEDKSEKVEYTCVERCFGIFERRVDIGRYVDRTKIRAKYDKGVLKVILPLSEEKKVRNIPIE